MVMENLKFLDNVEEKKKAIGIIHRVYITQLKNSRKYTASTKTKSEVRGGGRKPWKQKGTGRARAGSLRSPLFVGGGISFGPKPRIVNKKEKRLAILAALYLKKNSFLFLNEQEFIKTFEKVKTKMILSTLNNLKIEKSKKVLFLLTTPKVSFYKNFWLSSRNLKNVEVTTTASLNLNQILNAEYIVLSETALSLVNS
jgi:large subunit ribosomal protein L4